MATDCVVRIKNKNASDFKNAKNELSASNMHDESGDEDTNNKKSNLIFILDETEITKECIKVQNVQTLC